MLDKKRVFLFFIFVGLFSIVFTIGSYSTVSIEEAELFLEEFEELIEDIDAVGIFFHNLVIALPMFIPGFGIGWGMFSAWQTGIAFSAFTVLNPALSQIPAITILFATPFGLMELAAYAIAMSRSLLLVQKLIKKIPIKLDIKIILTEIGIVIGLLLGGGFIEIYMINLFEEGAIQMPGV